MKSHTTRFAVALSLVVLLGASAVQAAEVFCVTIVASKQGALVGSGKVVAYCGAKIEGLGFGYGVTSPRDQSTGLATGKRQHKPLRIKKEWGAASPQLFQALISGEPLSTVTLEFFNTDMRGVRVLDHTINLTNAFVTSIEHSADYRLPSGQPNNEFPTEIVEFTFQRIEFVDVKGKTSAID